MNESHNRRCAAVWGARDGREKAQEAQEEKFLLRILRVFAAKFPSETHNRRFAAVLGARAARSAGQRTVVLTSRPPRSASRRTLFRGSGQFGGQYVRIIGSGEGFTTDGTDVGRDASPRRPRAGRLGEPSLLANSEFVKSLKSVVRFLWLRLPALCLVCLCAAIRNPQSAIRDAARLMTGLRIIVAYDPDTESRLDCALFRVFDGNRCNRISINILHRNGCPLNEG